MVNALLVLALVTALSSVDEARQVRVGDEIKLAVRGHPELAGRYPVSGQGEVFLQTLGAIPVAEIPGDDIEAFMADRIAEFFHSPVEVRAELRIRVHMIGEIARPGTYFLGRFDTLNDLVAAAGGPTYRGNLRGMKTRRLGEKIDADLHRAMEEGTSATESGVRSGDVIHVPRRYWPTPSEFFTWASVIFVSQTLYDRYLRD